MNLFKNSGRKAGMFYLLVAVFAGYSQVIRTNIIVHGDTVATVSHVLTSETLFRTSIVSDLMGQIFHVLLALVLYQLFKTVNQNQARLMFVLALVPVPIACLNMANQFAPLLLLNGSIYHNIFEPAQLQSQILFFLDLHKHGILIAQLFWGLWLLPLGYLVFKSEFIPKLFGILLMIACFCYLAGSLITFLFPNYETMFQWIYAEPAIAEILFAFWLLIKGVKFSKLNS